MSGFSPKLVLTKGLGCGFEGWDIFRGGCFQSKDFNNQALQRSRTSRADERRVGRPVPGWMAISFWVVNQL